jgi:hypothetical protein
MFRRTRLRIDPTELPLHQTRARARFGMNRFRASNRSRP